jgi:hypothetical protein
MKAGSARDWDWEGAGTGDDGEEDEESCVQCRDEG